MLTYLCVLAFFVLFAGLAMTVGEGLWSNTISLLAVLISGTLGVLLGPPLGAMGLEKLEKSPEQMWYFTFAGVWLVYFISIMVTRILAERISKVRVKFVPPLEMVAGPLMGLLVSVMFTSFVIFTLYSIPVRAGVWNYDQSSEWQKSTFRTGAGPFYSVVSALGGSDVAQATMAE